jgi:hypothetical protein
MANERTFKVTAILATLYLVFSLASSSYSLWVQRVIVAPDQTQET